MIIVHKIYIYVQNVVNGKDASTQPSRRKQGMQLLFRGKAWVMAQWVFWLTTSKRSWQLTLLDVKMLIGDCLELEDNFGGCFNLANVLSWGD